MLQSAAKPDASDDVPMCRSVRTIRNSRDHPGDLRKVSGQS